MLKSVAKAGLSWCLSLAVFWYVSSASARVSGESGYDKARTYSGALRFLRVDKGFSVTERDPDAAYLIFEYPLPSERNRTAPGTIEIIQVKGSVKIFVQIAKMPEYHERVLRDGLLQKLHDEYGEPPRPPAKNQDKNKPKGEKPKPDTK